MVRFNKEFLIIKISALRDLYKEVSGSIDSGRSKRELLAKIPDKYADRIKELALYYQAVKEKAMYLSKMEKKAKFDTLKNTLENLPLKKVISDWIYENKGHMSNEKKLELTLRLKIHTNTKRIHAENSKTLEKEIHEFRHGRPITIIFHIEDEVVEFKTPILTIHKMAEDYISKNVLNFELSTITKFNPKKKNEEKCKEVTISDLNFAGADKIAIKGDDVKLTLRKFVEQGIDLEKNGKAMFGKFQLADDFKISGNGQITCKANLDDAYSKLKERYLFG